MTESTTPITPGMSLLMMTNEALALESQLMAAADLNGGEVPPALDLMLQEMEQKIAEKADTYKYVIDRLEASESMLLSQAEAFDKAAQAMSAAARSLKDRIKAVMVLQQKDEVRGVNWKFKLCRAKPKLDINVEDLPASFVEEVTTRKANRAKLEAALDLGAILPGVTRVEVTALRCFINKKD